MAAERQSGPRTRRNTRREFSGGASLNDLIFQLMTILEEAYHSLIFIEHDPLLYEDAAEMTEYVSLALREAAKDATVLLYAPEADPFLEELVKNADRVFYFGERPRAEARVVAKAIPRAQRSQTTLEAFS